MDKMIERLETIEQRFAYLDHMMMLPTVAGDFTLYRQYAKEKANLEKIAQLYRKYKQALATIEEGNALAKDPEPEIAEMGRIEAQEATTLSTELYEQIRIALIPKDPNDEKNVIVEIRGAVGGEEANIFAGDLFRMYVRYAEQQGWKVELLESTVSEMGGMGFVSFSLEGEAVYSKMKFESGGHRVQRVPKTEASGRIHTSIATVVIMPEAEEVDVQINAGDLRVDTYRSSGAGGQHINKTDSAVRITHLPTGIVVSCQEGRSQHDNRDKAMTMLRTRMYTMMLEQAEAQRGAERRSKVGTGERSEKIRTYNYPQNRVTDHRIGFTIQQLDNVMEGYLAPVIDALINEDQKQKLAGEMND